MLSSLLLLAAASAGGWYYPDESDHTETPPESWTTTGMVMVEVDSVDQPPLHPDVAHIEWLTHRPAVARLTLVAGADDFAVSRDLHGRDGVQWAHPDFRIPMVQHDLPDDPLVAEQWHLENTGQAGSPGTDINAEIAWAYATGAGQIIAIIDSGVDGEHPDLDMVGGVDVVDSDFDYYPSDGNAHGTACAGLAAGVGNNGVGIAGVAYDAQVYGVRYLSEHGSGSYYDAFIWAVDSGASVLSNSWGASIACDGYSIPASYRTATEYAETDGRGGLGSVVLFAAGNDNCDVSNDGLLTQDTVVGVAAVGAGDVRESYSSYGEPVDIAAPSGGLLTTDITGDSGYGNHNGDNNYTGGMSGTSASTPVVAGVFALMFEANPRLTAADAREVICQTATRNDTADAEYDETGWSPYYGCGRVDAGAAVAAVANEMPGTPESAVPVDEVYVDRIWLDWTAADDVDGDRLTYRVSWWVDDGEPTEEVTDGLSLELTGAAESGQTITWQVTATDLWGDGAPSPEYTLSVIDRPEPAVEEPTGGCQAVGGGVWWLMLLPLAARRRR